MKSMHLIQRCVLVLLSTMVIFTACAQEPKKKQKVHTTAQTEDSRREPITEQEDRTETPTQKAGQTSPEKRKKAGKKATQQQKNNKKKQPKQKKNKKVRHTQKKRKGTKQTAPKKTSGKPESKAKQAKQITAKHHKRKVADAKRYAAVKTNLPMATVAIPNLVVEVQLHKHITVDFPVMWSISDIEREHAIRGIAFQPEGRWWIEEAGKGHFFGVHAHFAWFNAKWKDNRYQTEKLPLMGAGISYGYKLPISRHWGAEFNLGAGYARMEYNTYYNIENGAWINKRVRNYWGITRLGLSLVYRF